jgi:HSP20 family protein
MRALSPWRPLRDELDDLFSRFFGKEDAGSWNVFENSFAPAVDTVVRDGKVVVKVDLPGIDPKSVDVTVHGDRLTLAGERKAEHEESKAGRFYRELRYGRFQRTVRLPGPVDPDTVTARYRDGVLEITMKAPAGAEPTRVPVTTA